MRQTTWATLINAHLPCLWLMNHVRYQGSFKSTLNYQSNHQVNLQLSIQPLHRVLDLLFQAVLQSHQVTRHRLLSVPQQDPVMFHLYQSVLQSHPVTFHRLLSVLPLHRVMFHLYQSVLQILPHPCHPLHPLWHPLFFLRAFLVLIRHLRLLTSHLWRLVCLRHRYLV